MGRKYREYSYEEYMMAMILYYYFKLGPTKISRILGIKEGTVRGWLYYGRVPPMAKWTAKPSNELAYVMGVLHHGDGSVSMIKKRYRYVIQLNITDKEFGETFSRAMSRVLGVNYHEPWWDEKRKAWWVIYKSKAFYKWYKKTEKQGLEGFKPYIEYSKETVRYYLKGLFDSDGNNYRNEQIYLYNSKEKLLKYVQYLLKEYFGIIATGPYLNHKTGTIMIINGVKTRYRHDYYGITVSRKEHVQKFLNEVGFSIVRKQLGLRKNEKAFVEGIGYVKPYRLVELGLFKLPFSDTQ